MTSPDHATVAGLNIAGIAFGTLLALVLNFCLSVGGQGAEGRGHEG